MKMETYQGYIDMGIMSPEVIEELEFGETLEEIRQKIGETSKEELPPVEEK